MEIRLSPELAAVVERDVAAGRFASVDEYIAEAIELLHERGQWRDESLEEQRAGLEAAWRESERGELIPLDEFRKEMQEMKAEWVPSRKTA
jgi:Arc/MetJ-type ribon-helix-helix transcriptional regulator